MGGQNSGGANRLTAAEHVLRGSFRPDRHGRPSAPAFPDVSRADRHRVLQGLSADGRRLVTALLSQFGDWDASGLETLRNYGLSSDRLRALQQTPSDDTGPLYRELRANGALLKQLNLERAR